MDNSYYINYNSSLDNSLINRNANKNQHVSSYYNDITLNKFLNNKKITNLNPEEMKRINYNPYKNKYESINPELLKLVKEEAFKNKTSLAVDEANLKKNEKRIKGAKYLEKLKKNYEYQANQNKLSIRLGSNNDFNLNDKHNCNINDVNTDQHNHEHESHIKNNPLVFFKTYNNNKFNKNTDEKIYINNVEYNRNNLNDISKKILEVCKYNNTKSKYANESLKTGAGKLMITNGKSIIDFSKKYNLNP